MHFTTTMSVSLVLFLVGLECVVLMSARELVKSLRENVTLTVVLEDEATEDEVARFQELMNKASYVLESKYISREEALQEHITNLGEDAFELRLKATYTPADSIAAIDAQLSTLPYINQIVYQTDIIDVLDRNITEVSFVLLIIAVILLVIALVLIGNTIQLQIYSKRFLINTMRLVGATPWVIKWPFIRRNLLMGVEAALLACVMIAGVYYYCVSRVGITLFPLSSTNIAFLISVVLLCGLIITFFASLAATNRYIRMKTNKLYEI